VARIVFGLTEASCGAGRNVTVILPRHSHSQVGWCENCLACYEWCPERSIETKIAEKGLYFPNPRVIGRSHYRAAPAGYREARVQSTANAALGWATTGDVATGVAATGA
jgi:hypothetical protein